MEPGLDEVLMDDDFEMLDAVELKVCDTEFEIGGLLAPPPPPHPERANKVKAMKNNFKLNKGINITCCMENLMNFTRLNISTCNTLAY